MSELALQIDAVRKSFGPVRALETVSIGVHRGELLTILGPSGSGKTTLLKVIAGFEYPDTGSIALEGRDITYTRPAARNIGMVFQNYALFPHMTVAENVGFPLRMRRVPRDEARRRVEQALDLVELRGYGDRLPAQLSGGQQQRVALARAVIFDPPLLLLDEPFGALDRKLREQMQLEVKHLQRRLNVTALFVTHDQEEALILSDRIAVLNDGVVQQVAEPKTLYLEPANRFVAHFIGESNLYTGKLHRADGRTGVELDDGRTIRLADSPSGLAPGAEVHVVIRPEQTRRLRAGDTADNVFEGRVAEAIFVGESHKYRIAAPSGLELLVRWSLGRRESGLEVGEEVRVAIAPDDVHVVR